MMIVFTCRIYNTNLWNVKEAEEIIRNAEYDSNGKAWVRVERDAFESVCKRLQLI